MKTITLYTSNCRENAANTYYQNKTIISSIEELAQAVGYDHISSCMRDSKRSNENFIEADCVHLDLDNTHSNNPDAWVTIDDVAEAFEEVEFYFVQSRNYMKVKYKENKKTGEKTAFEPREKYHLYFPLSKKITDANQLEKLKMHIVTLFPWFDTAAVDISHFFFGVENAKADYMESGFFEGICIDEYINGRENLRTEEEIAVNSYNHCVITSGWQPIHKQCDFLGIPRAGTSEGAEKSPEVNTSSDQNPFEWVAEKEQKQAAEWFNSWAKKYDVSIVNEYQIQSRGSHFGAITYCVRCCNESAHTSEGAENETVVIIDRGGKINYLCRHSHCSGIGWKDYRTYIEEHNKPVEPEPRQDAQTSKTDKPKNNTVGFPEPVGVDLDNRPPQAPELISGVVRKGHKMLIQGGSKIGKTFMLIELGCCIVTGRSWLGMSCESGNVLYLNLELDQADFVQRLYDVATSMSIPHEVIKERFKVWQLRGVPCNLEVIKQNIIDQANTIKAAAVIIDPIYKIFQGEENNSRDVSKFCSFLDEIAAGTGATIIYCHHHSKGNQGNKKSMDRSSGSGVFARDADALVDFIELDASAIGFILEDGATAFRANFTLRSFRQRKPFEITFQYPLHYQTIGLEKAGEKVGGDAQQINKLGTAARQQQKDKNIEKLINILRHPDNYSVTNKDGITVKVDTVGHAALYFGVSEKTIARWIKDSDGDLIKDGRKIVLSPSVEIPEEIPFEDEKQT